MAEQTKIAWTDATFNPWIGCEPAIQPNGKPHPGCVHCYAREQNKLRGWTRGPDGQPIWGPGAPRKVTSASYWRQPLAWARAAAQAGERRKVFCGSLCDVLDVAAPPESLARLWDLVRATSEVFVPDFEPVSESGAGGGCIGEREGGLDWLMLTKRPERWAVIPEDVRSLVWLGTSASDQPTWNECGRRLSKAEGFGRVFVSLEPMVGPVDASWLLGYCYHCDKRGIYIRPDGTHAVCGRPVVSWVICGGESGPGARPCEPEWIETIVRQCRAAGVRCYVKQDSGRHPGQQGRIPAELWAVKEFPEVSP